MGTRRKRGGVLPASEGTDWMAAAEALSDGPPPAPAPKPVVGVPVDPARCAPLEVRAHLLGRISLPHGPMAIDSLLAAMVCLREGVPPALTVEDVHPVEIPVAREPAGRFHLASFSIGAFDRFEQGWINRRFPVDMAQAMAAPTLRRINVQGGPCKSYRIPIELGHVEGDVLRWYLVGDPEGVRSLLALAHYLGKRRGVGYGKVGRWEVERVEPWGPGFPVVSSEGKALRTLPLDWPGLVDPEEGYRVLAPPYWRREAEERCAVVSRSP